MDKGRTDLEYSLRNKELFEAGHTLAQDKIFSYEYPWQVLPHIKEIILEIGKTLPADKYDLISDGIWIAKSAKVSPTASISAPCIIGEDTEVRQCAFIRGSALVGDGCVIGNSTELKNCIISDGCQVPHFNYVGDSILGYKSHMGAGSITSNVKSDKTLVAVRAGDEKIETGLKKFGAMLGDFVEVGCNSVLNPGTVIGPRSNVYPLSSVRGAVPADSIFKAAGKIVKKI
jgi:NDP-sugar pyrophosphorylase family protein